MIMETRHFGLITARIFDADRRVELSFSPRYKDPISDQVRDRCLTWALDSLADLQEHGYIFKTPGTVPSG